MLELYKRIRQRREELGLSQEELAKILGYKSRSSINKIELGENDIPQSKIVAFAKALDTTPSYLMGWDEKAPAVMEAAEALRIYAEIKKGSPLTQEELNRLDDFAETFIKGLNK